MHFIYDAQAWLNATCGEVWQWLNTLSQHEWMVLLGIVAALGFLCMKGFAHRGTL